MTAPAPDTVVLDLGGVVLDWDPRHLYRQVFADEADMERFLATVCTPDFNDRLDRGLDPAAEVAALAARHPDHGAQVLAYVERWVEMTPRCIEGTAAVVDELGAAGVDLVVLSNMSAELFPLIPDELVGRDRFREIVLSGEVGVTKPAAELYRAAERRYGRAPGELLLVDDRAANVEAARALGWDAVVFTDAPALRTALVERGLLGRSPSGR